MSLFSFLIKNSFLDLDLVLGSELLPHSERNRKQTLFLCYGFVLKAIVLN